MIFLAKPISEAMMRLSGSDVRAAALDLLDEVGLDRLTMRGLATALGVQNGATYWHFKSKQALLEAMADAMLAGVADDLSPLAPWDRRVAELAHRLRRALLSRRDGGRLFATSFFPLPNALAYGEALVGALLGAGLPARDAAWTADTVTYYVVGHATEEQLAAGPPASAGLPNSAGLPDGADLPDGGGPADSARLAAALHPTRHPSLIAVGEHLSAPHPAEHFDHGLTLIIAGIAARLPTQPTPPA
ncbi:tetracycline resistance transcriptional repressor TetR(A) [Rugosimonospora acidiphila]|uniref:Tetracycline resistance transcriptional repressor TetR(A) n=1 Tax=Rugosimonospora acidiphila TaxID=556531 RepID=A0ABP9RRH3_9ACTN